MTLTDCAVVSADRKEQRFSSVDKTFPLYTEGLLGLGWVGGVHYVACREGSVRVLTVVDRVVRELHWDKDLRS